MPRSPKSVSHLSPVLPAEPYLADRETAAVVKAAKELAGRITLPASHGWMIDEGRSWKALASEVEAACEHLRPAKRKQDFWVATVTAMRTAKDAENVRIQLETPRNLEWRHWDFDTSMDYLTETPVIAPNVFGLSVRRPGRRKEEGLLAGSRAVHVTHRDGKLELDYHIDLKLIYVIPAARGALQGAALIAAATEMIRQDLRHLAAEVGKLDRKIKVNMIVAGDAYSSQGLSALDDVAIAMERHALAAFGKKIECDRDYPSRVLENQYG